MSGSNERHGAARSATTRLILAGTRSVRRYLEGRGPCPCCDPRSGGEHESDCIAMEILMHDPLFRREAREVKRG